MLRKGLKAGAAALTGTTAINTCHIGTDMVQAGQHGLWAALGGFVVSCLTNYLNQVLK